MIKKINAVYTEETIRVYQAFNAKIADEAVRLGKFGKNFSRSRMTWIKPSFLWMMYRSGWAEKENQERVLAVDISREGFEEILKNAVLSSYHAEKGESREEWKERVEKSQVRCQFDPDRDIYGNPLEIRAIQLGLRGEFVNRYVDEWIINITDITEEVKKLKSLRDSGRADIMELPKEREYPVSDEIKKILCMGD